jgi:hypothetical protein
MLLDIDGYEMAGRIRRTEEGAELPTILMTVLQALCNVLTKPQVGRMLIYKGRLRATAILYSAGRCGQAMRAIHRRQE